MVSHSSNLNPRGDREAAARTHVDVNPQTSDPETSNRGARIDSSALDLPGEPTWPHRMANELTADASLAEGALADEPAQLAAAGRAAADDRARAEVWQANPKTAPTVQHRQIGEEYLTVGERRIGMQIIAVVLGITALGLLLAAALTRQWLLLGLAGLAFVPFMLLLLAPVWLATSTKIAQDDNVRRTQASVSAAQGSADRLADHKTSMSPSRRSTTPPL